VSEEAEHDRDDNQQSARQGSADADHEQPQNATVALTSANRPACDVAGTSSDARSSRRDRPQSLRKCQLIMRRCSHAAGRCRRRRAPPAAASSDAECETSMRPKCDLDLRRTCRTSQILACSTSIEVRAKAADLRKVPARACEAVKADDGSRTRDLRLGKPTLYRLSYVRA
jgi:hypothetical protein